MKCYGCGYEKREGYKVEKVIRFKSGKRKGEIKGTERVFVEPDKDADDFKKVILQTLSWSDWSRQTSAGEIEIYICPKCGTLRTEE